MGSLERRTVLILEVLGQCSMLTSPIHEAKPKAHAPHAYSNSNCPMLAAPMHTAVLNANRSHYHPDRPFLKSISHSQEKNTSLLTSPFWSQVTEYLERLSDVRGLSKMALRRVEHLYYKNDLVYGAMRKLVQQQQAATAQQTTQTQQEGSDEAVEAEDLDEEETEAKQVHWS
jgi:hypothetical protein